MSSLREKSVSGVAWSLIEKFGVTVIKFILGIILARLLTPEDFGLIGMITVFFVIAQVFVDSGFGMAYVQKKHINDADADTVFYTNMIISLVLFLILYICAPLIAVFYDQPQLVLLTRVMAVVIIINAFNVIQRAQIIRSVSFKKLTKVNLFSSLLSGTVGIIAAYKGMDVWALVLQSLSNRSFVAIGFWYTSDYRPKWRFSKKSFKNMFSFGSWMLFSNLLTTFFNNIYVFAIGKFFPVAQLGYYSKAQQLVSLSTNNISQAVGSVAFPVYSQLQNDKERLRNAMQKFIQNTMFITIPLIAILIVVVKPFILLFLTEKWAPMIPYLKVICFAAIFYPLNQINAQALIAIGKSKLSFNLTLVRNSLRLINIFINIRHGVIYMLIGEVIIAWIFFFINASYNKKFNNYGIFKQIIAIWEILLGGTVATSFALFVSVFMENMILWLVTGILITGITYLFIEYVINRELINSSISLIKNFKTNKI